MKWVRARTDEQKGQRIQEIVSATARLFNNHKFEEITFAAIAKEATFTRSNLYKYFGSKEEIFVEFLILDIQSWIDDFRRSCDLDHQYTIEEFANVWVEIQIRHGRMLKLVSILNTFLEKNITFEKLVEFKRSLISEITVLSRHLISLFPELNEEKAIMFLNLQFAVASGLIQMCDHTDDQKRVLNMSEFAVVKIDFDSHFLKATEFLLAGLLH